TIRSSESAVTDRLAPSRQAARTAARQRPLPDAKIAFGGEVSFEPPSRFTSPNHLFGASEQPCRHNDDGALTMSPFALSTMANNSLCSASGTLNFAIVSSKSLQKASHSLSVILRCLWDSLMERPV